MIRWIERLDDAAAGLALFGCFVVVCGEIIARSVFEVSFSWSAELSRYLIIVSTYLGAAAAVRSMEHIRVEFLIDRFPKGLRRVVEVSVALVSAVFTGTVAVAGYRWVSDMISLGLISAESSLPVPIWVFQVAVPVGFAVMTARLLARAWLVACGDLPPSPSATTAPSH